MAPVYAIFLQSIDGTLLENGIALAIYTILKGVLCLSFANIKPKQVSHKTMMTLGYIVMGLVYFAYPGTSALMHVFILQALLSIGESLITPSWSALIAISLDEGREREIYSKFYGFRALFEGCAAIIGGLIAMQMGFSTIFYLMAIFALISAILMQFLEKVQVKN